jgi:hypothetical protein
VAAFLAPSIAFTGSGALIIGNSITDEEQAAKTQHIKMAGRQQCSGIELRQRMAQVWPS